MVQLLSRKEALKKNTVLASFIKYAQDNTYAPEIFEPGENWIEEEGRWVELTKEECLLRNRPILAEFEKIRDKLESVPDLNQFIDESIITTQAQDEVHIEIMAEGLEELSEKLNWGGVLFIFDYPFSWMEFLDPNKQVDSEVIEWFENNGADKNFNGAIYASHDDLFIFIRHLLLLKTSNPDFPACSIAGVNSAAIGSACKYGNIHFLFYEKDVNSGFENAVPGTGLEEIPFGACTYKF